MSADEFEWDASKARSNLAKHKVSFATATQAFGDAFAVERLDADAHGMELRYILSGMVRGVLLTVIYSERNGRTRIISARRATRHEQADYYRSQTTGRRSTRRGTA